MRSLSVLGAAVALVFFQQAVAWAFPVGAPVTLSYGARYTSPGGGEAVHRGADVACSAGETVKSPLDGEVTFVGRIPSAAGGTVIAVSIRAGDDLVSLMPMDEVSVEQGENVRCGEDVGVVAVAGDPSAASTHLHVGLRRNAVYIDPSSILTAGPAADVGTEVVDAPAPARLRDEPRDVGVGADGAVLAGVAVSPRATAAGACIPAQSLQATPVDARLAPDASARRATSAQPEAVSQIAPGVSLPVSGVSGSAAAPIARTPFADGGQLTTGLLAGAMSPPGIAAVVAAIAGVSILLSRRAIERRFQSNPPVSDRFGNMLQHVRAGDTLCGLTSCSGLLPSQSRGRSAQRR